MELDVKVSNSDKKERIVPVIVKASKQRNKRINVDITSEGDKKPKRVKI